MREVFYASLICLLLVGVWHFMREDVLSSTAACCIVRSGEGLQKGVDKVYFITQIDLD